MPLCLRKSKRVSVAENKIKSEKEGGMGNIMEKLCRNSDFTLEKMRNQ